MFGFARRILRSRAASAKRMNVRKYSLLLFSFVVFGFSAAIAFSQEDTDRIQVIGAVAIREAAIEQPELSNDTSFSMGLRILFLGALTNRETQLSDPTALDEITLIGYLNRIIIQGALANRTIALERPSFLPAAGAPITSVEATLTPTKISSPTPTITSLPTPTSTSEPSPTQTSTSEAIAQVESTPDETIRSGSETPVNHISATSSPTLTATVANLDTPVNSTVGTATPTTEATTTPAGPIRSPEVEAAYITNFGVIVAAIIGAAATMLIYILSQRKKE